MRRAISALTSLILIAGAALTSRADNTCEFSVQVSATVQEQPARITLNWPQDTYTLPNSYAIYRKTPGAHVWGAGTMLPGDSTSFTDTNVTVGTGYEYQIIKNNPQYSGYGYLYAGLGVPLTERRGKLLL